MKRIGTVLALIALTIGVTPPSAVADWSADQPPDDQSIWRVDGPSACPEVFFIGLRGSGQNGVQAGAIEFGDQIERLFREYSAAVHRRPLPGSVDGVRVAPVPPPGYRAAPAADWADLLDPFGAYWESVDGGAAATVQTLRRAAARCGTETRFVLAGFSQGAQAVTAALPKVPKHLRPRIAAVLLVASPTWRGDQAITYFGHDPDWAGSLAEMCTGACGGAIKPWAATRTAALCHEGDAICTGLGFVPLHAQYTTEHLAELASWAADRTIVDQPIPTCNHRRATHVGTAEADTIRGTPHRDVVVALGGDDLVTTRGGGDFVCAGDGNDVISTGSGRDRIWAGPGRDAVDSGPADDRILGQAGSDGPLDGGGGSDVIRGGGAVDELHGGRGNDTLIGGGGIDRCDGGDGADTFESCELVASG